MNVRLRVVQGRPMGKTIYFPPGEYVIGRGDECHVRPNSTWVSRQHCLLRVKVEGVFLRDLGSRNGTLVNGARLLEECSLNHGDELHIGPLVFRVLLEEARPGDLPPFQDMDGEKRPDSTEEIPTLPSTTPPAEL